MCGVVGPFSHEDGIRDVKSELAVVASTVGAVMLIAYLNVSNLFVLRAFERRRERQREPCSVRLVVISLCRACSSWLLWSGSPLSSVTCLRSRFFMSFLQPPLLH